MPQEAALVQDPPPSPTSDRAEARSEWFRSFFERSPYPMWVFDAENLRFLDVNKAAIEFYGYTREEFLSMTSRDLRTPDEAKRLETFVRTLPSGTNVAGVWRHRKKDGTFADMDILAHSIAFHGRPALLVFARDVTHVTEAADTMRKLTAMVEHTTDAVVVTDREGRIDYVNAAFEALTGYSKDEVLGKNPRILKSGRQDQAFYTNLWDTILAGQVFRGVLVNRKKNGELYDEEKTITPLRDWDGRITHFVSIDRDVTALREAQRQAARNEQLASLGRMAAFIAHEINNPLTNISLLTSSLRQKSLDPEVEGIARKIDEQRFLAVRIMADVLSFARPLEVHPEETDVRQVVEQALRQAEAYRREGVRLAVSLGDRPVRVRVDALRMLEVLVNLLKNALQATKAGRVAVSLETRPDAVAIVVADEGGGLPPEAIPRLFEPFASTKPASAGTGLGLAISKNLVEAHGGRIEVTSQAAKGTTFTVLLPRPGGPSVAPPSRSETPE